MTRHRVFRHIWRAAHNAMLARNWPLASHYWGAIALLYREWRPTRVTASGVLVFEEREP